MTTAHWIEFVHAALATATTPYAFLVMREAVLGLRDYVEDVANGRCPPDPGKLRVARSRARRTRAVFWLNACLGSAALISLAMSTWGTESFTLRALLFRVPVIVGQCILFYKAWHERQDFKWFQKHERRRDKRSTDKKDDY